MQLLLDGVERMLAVLLRFYFFALTKSLELIELELRLKYVKLPKEWSAFKKSNPLGNYKHRFVVLFSFILLVTLVDLPVLVRLCGSRMNFHYGGAFD